MKLKFLIIVMALAAMGPARDAPPPKEVPAAKPARPMSPEEMADTSEPEAERPELTIYEASEASPDDFQWTSRPVVVFADTPNDPAFIEQMRALRSAPRMLIERDVVVITDTEPQSGSDWRRRLHPRGFSLVVLDKDGQVKLRKPLPWDVREISRAIDKFPLRRQEIGRAGAMP
ncbi:DUF4174 domain-containing protein [Paracoccus methylarcula]|uniref:DUF4174 domain-containing protein n=2 Tax=Paracoccus methylarcula TaxID=72022 RepID=A0A422R0T8_9RHOB|nr:DUF4174 domain-containing protein [Paracoccus methylarcula]RNF35753.1 DUF4174 domain-containing protein [Paracoccus methylarcula]